MNIEVRQALHPEHAKKLTTEELRKHFLVDTVFEPGNLRLYYSLYDRILFGGVMPLEAPLPLEPHEALATEFFLQRRELGTINLGGDGAIVVDDKRYDIQPRDGLYIGMGAERVSFESKDPAQPAKFYCASATAHAGYPTVHIPFRKANPLQLGEDAGSNKRTIYQYVHPKVLKSCQLAMGMTLLDPRNVWNTMPCHTHDRRMEVYLYFDLDKDSAVFHLMGEPTETRHLVVRNEEAVISPNWSIHSGVGTGNYTFIWAMVGENQEFTDMDAVPMEALR